MCSQLILPAEKGLSLLGDSLAAVWLHYRGEGFGITHSLMLTNWTLCNAIEVSRSFAPFEPTKGADFKMRPHCSFFSQLDASFTPVLCESLF